MRLPPHPRRAFVSAAVLIAITALTAAAAGCGTSGRELREPNREALYPTRSTAAPQASTQAPTPVQLVSDNFQPGSAIPAAHGCGKTPPSLRWFGLPADTVEVGLGLVNFDEPDPTKKVRWLVSGLPAGDGSLAAGAALPAGAQALANGDGGTGYAGPCPPPGTTHTYNFMVFALKEPSQLTPATPAAEAFAALQSNAANDIAYYTGTFAG